MTAGAPRRSGDGRRDGAYSVRRAGSGWAALPADEWMLPAFVALAMVLGGGGSPAPLPEMVLELTALLALVAVLWLEPSGRRWPPLALLATGLMILLPALQLIPLPPTVWRALPGRDGEAAALALLGGGERWMPWSLSPPRTLAALLALLPPAAALVLTARASPGGRRTTLLTVAVVALLSVAFGAAQLAAGDGALRPYGAQQPGALLGFQANRNAEADVLLIGLLATAALWLARPPQTASGRRLLAAAAALLLVVGTVLTASRAGIALLVAVLAGPGLWLSSTRGPIRAGRRAAALAAGLAALAIAAWAARGNVVLGRIAARFAEGAERRPELWADTLYAIGRHWPWGAGLGSFVPVFVAAERLEVVESLHPNRAHNDFLELALEAGLPGLLLLAGLAALLMWRLVARLRAVPSPGERAELVFAAAVLSLIAAHSVVDYPLRSMALATLAGVAAGIILVPIRESGRNVSARRAETDIA